jgi:hypothetical protein
VWANGVARRADRRQNAPAPAARPAAQRALNPPHRDDRWLQLVVRDDRLWGPFCAAIGRLIRRPTRASPIAAGAARAPLELGQELAAVFAAARRGFVRHR